MNLWDMTITNLSQLMHELKYTFNEYSEKYEKSMLIISIDVDVGNKILGQRNKGSNNENVSNTISEEDIGYIEQNAFPIFLDVFDKYDFPVTFALRGELLEVDKQIVNNILDRTVIHDIGSHGYTHKAFTNMSIDEASKELSLLSEIFKEYKIKLKSFVFPKNRIKHLNLLEDFGYKCYREYGDFKTDGMYIKKVGKLYDIHPSFYLDKYARVGFLKNSMKIAINKKRPFHLWFHMWNFGINKEQTKKYVTSVLEPFLKAAKIKEDNGLINFETMSSSIQYVKGGNL